MKYLSHLLLLCVAVTFYVIPLAFEDRNERYNLLLRYPHIRAFLDTIAYAEGTLHDNGYRTLYGGDVFDHFHDHPRRVIKSTRHTNALASSAAGRYQILARTWDYIARLLGVRDFSPLSQDKVALKLIDGATGLQDILAHKPERAWRKIGSIWPSLSDEHEQYRVSAQQLRMIYNRRLKWHINAQ